MFTKARLKLTLYYTMIITIVIIIFSGVLFNLTSERVRQNQIEFSHLDNDPGYERVFENYINDFLRNLLISDILVILLAAFLSYFLAGETLRPIQKALDAQEQFSANTSHELRTPLSVLKTQLEVFLKKKDPSTESANKLAESSLEEVDRMIAMTHNLLLLARSKKDMIDIGVESLNISPVLKRVSESLRQPAEAKGLEMNISTNESLIVKGNEKMFEQVFFNLIQNSINYSEKGVITISSELQNGVVIKISDTGIGIGDEDLQHIFEPFYKADKSRTISDSGVGLGLSITKDIVETMSGTIKLESKDSFGTTVILTFPQVKKLLS